MCDQLVVNLSVVHSRKPSLGLKLLEKNITLVRQQLLTPELERDFLSYKCLYHSYNPDFGLESFLSNNFSSPESNLAVVYYCPNSVTERYAVFSLYSEKQWIQVFAQPLMSYVKFRPFYVGFNTISLKNRTSDQIHLIKQDERETGEYGQDPLVDALERGLQFDPNTGQLKTKTSIVELLRNDPKLWAAMQTSFDLLPFEKYPNAPFLKLTIVNPERLHLVGREERINWEISQILPIYLLDFVFRRLGVRIIANQFCNHTLENMNMSAIVAAVAEIERNDSSCHPTNVRFLLSDKLMPFDQEIARFLESRSFHRLGMPNNTYLDSIDNFSLATALTFVKRLIFGTRLSENPTLFEGAAENLRSNHQNASIDKLQWHPSLFRSLKIQTIRYHHLLKINESMDWKEEYPFCGDQRLHSSEQCECNKFGCYYIDESTQRLQTHDCCNPKTCKLNANKMCGTGECCDFRTCSTYSTHSQRTCGNVLVFERYCAKLSKCTQESEFCNASFYQRDKEVCNGDSRGTCFDRLCNFTSFFVVEASLQNKEFRDYQWMNLLFFSLFFVIAIGAFLAVKTVFWKKTNDAVRSKTAQQIINKFQS